MLSRVREALGAAPLDGDPEVMFTKQAFEVAVDVFQALLEDPSPTPALVERFGRKKLVDTLGILLALRALAPAAEEIRREEGKILAVIKHRREQPCPSCSKAAFCEDCGVCDECGFCRPEPGEVH